MRVMIADDEEKVCQLIHTLVDWESLGMEVIKIVHNGIEAIEEIEKHSPDIVITDIRMPGYDGLEMIKMAKEMNDSIEFIIISGYRHFEYAQNAIKFGVKDYLLKPIKKSELNDTLERIRDAYLERTRRLTIEEKNRMSLKNNLDKLRAMLFKDIIFKNSELKNTKELKIINEDYHYTFKPGNFQIVIFKFDGVNLLTEENSSYIQGKLSQSIQKYLKGKCTELEFLFEGNFCYLLLNYNDFQKREIRKKLKVILDELLLQKDILSDLKITIGLGTIKNNVWDLNESNKTAIWAIEQRIVLGINRVIEGLAVSSNNLADSQIFFEFNKSLTEAIDKLSVQELRRVFLYLKEQLPNKEGITGHEIIQMGKEALNLYLICMRQNKIFIKDRDSFFENYSNSINNMGTIDEIFTYMQNTIIRSFDECLNDKRLEDNKPIRDAKAYIKEHYGESITLEIVSDIVGFNSTYFSSLFKKETGKTFSEYLMKIRMENTKEFLKETNCSVAEICEKVGYNDVKHFTKVFTKYTKLKPSEYRKIYS